MSWPRLSERDVSTRLIIPALQAAGWDIPTQVREEIPLTDGRVIVRGQASARGNRKRADFVLYRQANLPLAVIEAKADRFEVGTGMQQALEYAEMLDVPFAFATNGKAFLWHDRTGLGPVEQEFGMDQFPSPEVLWQAYSRWKGWSPAVQALAQQPYHYRDDNREPRYYQVNAINRVIEAVGRNQPRILLVMATGTGKTYTAFQIAWRLREAGVKRRILFLADRNILVDQTKGTDFSPFGPVMTKITNRTIDDAFEVYLALYQAVSGPDAEQNIYKDVPSDFFDLIIVDECHRGSAADDAAWRSILEHFSPATQLGLTATPVETRTASNTDYFGEPVYTYSLKQGIEDGFLAPYKVVRYDLDRDLIGFRPEQGATDRYGEIIEDRNYNLSDYDRSLILEKRTELVAKAITDYLGTIGEFSKTIVFCENTDHAERMRSALVRCNERQVLADKRYVVRITHDDEFGKSELYNFADPNSLYPVIATTSKMLTTGVDVKTCKLIVLDKSISSLTEFKQIIGRGTRIDPERGKTFFTIMDFRRATELFADPDFDGEPVQIFEPSNGDDLQPAASYIEQEGPEGSLTVASANPPEDRRVYYVDGVSVNVVARRVQYLGADGALINESLSAYTAKRVTQKFGSLDNFLQRWSEADRKRAVIEALEEEGVIFEALRDEVKNGKDYGVFDLLLHVAYDRPLRTRRERANRVRASGYFDTYEAPARRVLEALLDKYADQDIDTLENPKVLQLRPFSDIGTPFEIVRGVFGTRDRYAAEVQNLERAIFKEA